MKIYIASNFANKAAVNRASQVVQRAGHMVVQTWTHENSATPMAVAASRDLRELNNAELLLILNLPGCEPPGRGTLFEAGYAIARGMWVVLVGKRVGLTFLELPVLVRFRSLKLAMNLVRDIGPSDLSDAPLRLAPGTMFSYH